MKRLVLVSALLCLAGPVHGRTILVPGDFTAIQDAIADANDGDVVVVSPGTYIENIDFLGKAIAVRSRDPNDSNVVATTVIDGSAPADANFGSVVVFHGGEAKTSVLEGFTITGGTGSWLAVSWEFKGLQWNRCGGGAACWNMAAPTIRKNVFINNSAAQGGGVYVYGDPVNPDDPSNPLEHISPVISDNSFLNNQAVVQHGFTPPNENYPCNDHGDGGAIVCFQGVDAVITANLIESNHADAYGGGVHLRQWSNGVVANNRITGNDSLIGSGVHITYSSSPQIVGNLIDDNESATGGGIYVYYLSEPNIVMNHIRANSAMNGAVGVHYGSGGQIYNNVICDNTLGPAVILTGSSPQITQNTIADNEVCGIRINGESSPRISNNIVAFTAGGYGIAADSVATWQICHNNLWGNELGDYGQNVPDQTGICGNISADPGFVDSNGGDYHLTIYSPCVDAGDNNLAPAALELDMDDEPRIFTFDPCRAPVVDIGADEVFTLPADVDDDGSVSYPDLSLMAQRWLEESQLLGPGLGDDPVVNLWDYAFLAGQWGWTAPWAGGERAAALEFDSALGGYVRVHTPEGCILNNVFTFTYAAWVYPLGFSQSSARIIGKNERALMISYGGTLKGYSHGGGTAMSVSAVQTLEVGKWHLVMMIYDYYNGDKKIHLYADGSEVQYQFQIVGAEQRPPLVDWWTEGKWDLYIGSQAWTPGNNVPDAIIDEVAIYNRVLSQTEIQYLYNGRLGRPVPLSPAPIGLWHLDEGQGLTVYDSSGNDNHGMLEGQVPPAWTQGRFLHY